VRERHRGPYRAAIVPPIAPQRVELPSAVLALADAASIEIARFDAETEFSGMRRSQMWQAREILDALDAFAARASRRNLG
jgi:hypothetical protein